MRQVSAAAAEAEAEAKAEAEASVRTSSTLVGAPADNKDKPIIASSA